MLPSRWYHFSINAVFPVSPSLFHWLLSCLCLKGQFTRNHKKHALQKASCCMWSCRWSWMDFHWCCSKYRRITFKNLLVIQRLHFTVSSFQWELFYAAGVSFSVWCLKTLMSKTENNSMAIKRTPQGVKNQFLILLLKWTESLFPFGTALLLFTCWVCSPFYLTMLCLFSTSWQRVRLDCSCVLSLSFSVIPHWLFLYAPPSLLHCFQLSPYYCLYFGISKGFLRVCAVYMGGPVCLTFTFMMWCTYFEVSASPLAAVVSSCEETGNSWYSMK